MRAQFGNLSRSFGTLRRRRNELEYLAIAGDRADAAEAGAALASTAQLVDAVERLLPNLGLF